MYLFMFSLSIIFSLWFAITAQSSILFFFLIINISSSSSCRAASTDIPDLLSNLPEAMNDRELTYILIIWPGLGDPAVSLNPTECNASHSRTDTVLCIYDLEVCSSFNPLHNSL